RRALGERGLLAQHPLAVVLEVGLNTLRERAHLVALTHQVLVHCFRTFEVREGLRIEALGELAFLGERISVEVGHGDQADCCSSGSSTISAAATSSSDGADAAPGSPAPASLAAACCWAAAYRRCEKSCSAAVSDSCARVTASTSGPASVSLSSFSAPSS